LIEKLALFPDEMDVFMMQTDDESPYNMVQTCEVREIVFGAPDIPKKQWGKDKVIAITDEY
jgi:hypothetical protein